MDATLFITCRDNLLNNLSFSTCILYNYHTFLLNDFKTAVNLEGGVSIVKRNVKLAVSRIHVNSLTVSVKKVTIYFLYVDTLVCRK